MSASLAAMLQRIPLWHMRCLMSVLQAASVTPLPWAALSEGGGGGAEVFHRVVEVEQVLVAAPGWWRGLGQGRRLCRPAANTQRGLQA